MQNHINLSQASAHTFQLNGDTSKPRVLHRRYLASPATLDCNVDQRGKMRALSDAMLTKSSKAAAHTFYRENRRRSIVRLHRLEFLR